MRTFKVISLSVGGANNKIFSSGDTVTENQFPQGNADKLVKGGFLVETTEKPVIKEKSILAEINSAEAEKPEITEEPVLEDKKNKKHKRF